MIDSNHNGHLRRWRSLLFGPFFLAVTVFFLSGQVEAHKFHVSVSQVEFDRASQSARIMIRVFADDLENAIIQHSKRQVKIQGASAIATNREIGELIHAYLREKLELRNKAGRTIRLSWAGLEAQSDVVWLYVEGKVPGGLVGAQLRNRLFCELFEDQVNIVNTKHQQQTIGLMFEPSDDFKIITQKAKGK